MKLTQKIARACGSALIVLLSVLVTGCSQGPDFTVDNIIDRKSVYNSGYAVYWLETGDGVRGKGWGEVKFVASPSFANVGDKIIMIENTLTAVSTEDIDLH